MTDTPDPSDPEVGTAETDTAPPDAADIVAPEAQPPSDGDPVIYAVLTLPRGPRPLVPGQVVFAATSAITALIAAGGARLPDVGEVDRAAPFHYALPADVPPANSEEG